MTDPPRFRGRRCAAVLLPLAAAGVAAWLWTPDLAPSVLHARYLASPEDLVEVDGTRLHVRDEGPRGAPVLLLLHGLGSSLQTWDAWTATLRRDRRVLRVDLPGHGLSGPDATGDYGDARARALIDALLDARGIDRATLVGHSIGGRIAWGYAAARPARVERLVLVAPDGFEHPGAAYGRPMTVPAGASLLRWVLPRPALAAAIAPAYADPARLTDATLARYHDLLRAPGARAALIERMRDTVLEDPAPRLRSIGAPTLLLWGERDALVPAANAARYLRALPDATLATLPDVGHLPHEEAPRRSLAALRAFLR